MSDFIRYAMEAGGRLADQLATAEKRVNQLESENAKLQYGLRHKASEVLDVLRERNEFDAEIAKLREAVRKWVDVTTMIGTHRTCQCIACQELQRAISKKGGE